MEVLQDTYKDTKIGRIPKDWDIVKLKEVCSIEYGKDQKKVENLNGKYGIYGTGGLMNYSDEFLYNKPSVLIGRKGTIDKPRYIDVPFWTVDTLFYTKVFNDVDVKWFYYKCVRIPWRTLNEATGVPSLNRNNIYSFKISLPPLQEQQKIAAILSTVDEQISITDKIIEKSKELKKGLMQKLFSEGIGHTEFKDTKIGRIPKDWEVVKVGDICKLQGGFAFKSSDATENGVRWFKIANVGFNRVKWDVESFLPLGFEKKHPDFVLNEGDIVVAMTRPVLSGKLKICTIMKSDSGTLLNQRVGRVKLIDNNDSVYYYQSFNTKRFIDSVEGELFGTDPPNISSKLFESIKIPVPPKQERTKIAAILSEADAKIEKEQTQKTQLEQLKKGLMQQLLTGKKRVKV